MLTSSNSLSSKRAYPIVLSKRINKTIYLSLLNQVIYYNNSNLLIIHSVYFKDSELIFRIKKLAHHYILIIINKQHLILFTEISKDGKLKSLVFWAVRLADQKDPRVERFTAKIGQQVISLRFVRPNDFWGLLEPFRYDYSNLSKPYLQSAFDDVLLLVRQGAINAWIIRKVYLI